MASVQPFSALMPPAVLAADIASVPYDVIDSAEARDLARGHDRSFLHVIRPEIDLPDGTDLYSDAVYTKAAENLERWVAETPYHDDGPVLLVYRLIWRGQAQVGVVGGCSIDEYDDGRIAIHERTRQAKEDDRARHVTQMRCQAEPIFLAYRADGAVRTLVDSTMAGEPLYDFEAEDGIRHTVWRVEAAAELSAAFEAVPRLYVADGHHRAKSASRARAALRTPQDTGDEPRHRVMAALFPDDQLRILPYNRVVTELGGRSPTEVLAALGERFDLAADAPASPTQQHGFAVFAEGRWHGFEITPTGDGLIDQLDVSLLQQQVLEPIFGIADPRTDPRIQFVGGSRGTDELERRAEASDGVAFSLFPTSLAELFAVADAGAIMPPKATWFEPKLRSGMFLHRI